MSTYVSTAWELRLDRARMARLRDAYIANGNDDAAALVQPFLTLLDARLRLIDRPVQKALAAPSHPGMPADVSLALTIGLMLKTPWAVRFSEYASIMAWESLATLRAVYEVFSEMVLIVEGVDPGPLPGDDGTLELAVFTRGATNGAFSQIFVGGRAPALEIAIRKAYNEPARITHVMFAGGPLRRNARYADAVAAEKIVRYFGATIDPSTLCTDPGEYAREVAKAALAANPPAEKALNVQRAML